MIHFTLGDFEGNLPLEILSKIVEAFLLGQFGLQGTRWLLSKGFQKLWLM
jgi:hypothetical protein